MPADYLTDSIEDGSAGLFVCWFACKCGGCTTNPGADSREPAEPERSGRPVGLRGVGGAADVVMPANGTRAWLGLLVGPQGQSPASGATPKYAPSLRTEATRYVAGRYAMGRMSRKAAGRLLRSGGMLSDALRHQHPLFAVGVDQHHGAVLLGVFGKNRAEVGEV